MTQGTFRAHQSCARLTFSLAASVLVSAPVTAQQLPGYSGPLSSAQAEWSQSIRINAESGLQDWVNLAGRRDWSDLAAFFTDRGILIDGGGAAAAGRDAIRELLHGLPERSDYLLQVTAATGGTRLIYVAGRASYFEGDDLKVESFVALLELHRDRWMFRMLAFAPQEGMLAAAPLNNALAPNRARVDPPQRTAVRGVFEPSVVHQPGVEGAGGWQAFGGAIGVELDRTVEARAFFWGGGGPDTASSAVFGAELRVFVTNAGRTRPNLLAGAARLPGTGSSGARWDGLAGAGVAIAVTEGAELHVSARTPPATWFSQNRTGRVLFGLGLSYAVGRPPVWRDAELSAFDEMNQMTELPGFTPSVVGWAAALSRRERDGLDARYAPTASLYAPNAVLHGAPDVIASWLDAAQPLEIVIEQQRVSGSVAYAELALTDSAGERRVLNVYERGDKGWTIRSQVVW